MIDTKFEGGCQEFHFLDDLGDIKSTGTICSVSNELDQIFNFRFQHNSHHIKISHRFGNCHNNKICLIYFQIVLKNSRNDDESVGGNCRKPGAGVECGDYQ